MPASKNPSCFNGVKIIEKKQTTKTVTAGKTGTGVCCHISLYSVDRVTGYHHAYKKKEKRLIIHLHFLYMGAGWGERVKLILGTFCTQRSAF